MKAWRPSQTTPTANIRICRRISRDSTFTACPDRHRRHTSSPSAGDNAVRTIGHHSIPRQCEDHEVLR
jgi:hypothetical protein